MPHRDPFLHNVIDCRWQRTQDGWRFWVHGHPHVAGHGATRTAAREELEFAILAAAPDPDAIDPVVSEFWPPLPAGDFAERHLQPALRAVKGDAVFETVAFAAFRRDPAAMLAPDALLFRDGICPACNHGRGPRTDVPIRIARAPQRAQGGWIRAGFADFLRIYSQEFLDLLPEPERSQLALFPVAMPNGDRRRFFELRGPAQLQPVGVHGVHSEGHACTTCGRRTVRIEDPRLREPLAWLRTFVCAEDLPTPVRVLTVGHGHDVTLCVPQTRWAQLREDPRAAGMTTEAVGVVAAADCERVPHVRAEPGPCELCRDWPSPCTLRNEAQAAFDLPAETCSRRNFTWIGDAEQDGYVEIVSATVPLLALHELSQQASPPARLEYVGLRCTRCRRTGWIVLSPDPAQLSFDWR